MMQKKFILWTVVVILCAIIGWKFISRNKLSWEKEPSLADSDLCPGNNVQDCLNICQGTGCDNEKDPACGFCPLICGTLCGQIEEDIYGNNVDVAGKACQEACVTIVTQANVDLCGNCINTKPKEQCTQECAVFCTCLNTSGCQGGNAYQISCVPTPAPPPCTIDNCSIEQQERCHEYVNNPYKDPAVNKVQWMLNCQDYCNCLASNNCQLDPMYATLHCAAQQ